MLALRSVCCPVGAWIPAAAALGQTEVGDADRGLGGSDADGGRDGGRCRPAGRRAAARGICHRARTHRRGWATFRGIGRRSGRRSAWALTELQELGFTNVHAGKASWVPHWERGSAACVSSTLPPTLTGVALGGSVGTDDTGIEAPVVAVADLEARGLFGRIRARRNRLFLGADGARHGRAGYVRACARAARDPVEAARRGAVGMSCAPPDVHQPLRHTGATRYDPEVPQIPALALAQTDATCSRNSWRAEGPSSCAAAHVTHAAAGALGERVGEVAGAATAVDARRSPRFLGSRHWRHRRRRGRSPSCLPPRA